MEERSDGSSIRRNEHPLTKYIVSLGWEGFGDRLQCLSYCIDLALSRNRILVVNWSDRYFGGFHEYFQLVGVPYAETCPKGKTHPSIFEHLLNVPADYWVFDLVEQRIDDSSAFITVHPGVGTRTFNYYTLQKHLRFTPRTALEVAEEMQRLRNISTLPIVHLRGTDRPWTIEQIQKLADKHGEVALLSDDRFAVEAYLNISNGVSLAAARADGYPIHKTDTSRQRIIRMFADFCLLHEYGVGALNEDSLFWTIAKYIDVKEWFDPAPELVKYEEFSIRPKPFQFL